MVCCTLASEERPSKPNQWHGNSCGLIVRNDQPSWQGLPSLQHSCKQPTPILTYQGTFGQGVAARNVHVGSTSQARFFRQRPLAERARFDSEGPGPPQTNPGTWNAPTTSSAGRWQPLHDTLVRPTTPKAANHISTTLPITVRSLGKGPDISTPPGPRPAFSLVVPMPPVYGLAPSYISPPAGCLDNYLAVDALLPVVLYCTNK